MAGKRQRGSSKAETKAPAAKRSTRGGKASASEDAETVGASVGLLQVTFRNCWNSGASAMSWCSDMQQSQHTAGGEDDQQQQQVSELLLEELAVGRCPSSRIIDYATCAVRIGMVSPCEFVSRVLEITTADASPRFGAHVELLGGSVPYLFTASNQGQSVELDTDVLSGLPNRVLETAARAATLLAEGIAHGTIHAQQQRQRLHAPALQCAKLLQEWLKRRHTLALLLLAKGKDLPCWAKFKAKFLDCCTTTSKNMLPAHFELLANLQAVFEAMPVALGLEPMQVKDAETSAVVAGKHGMLSIPPYDSSLAVTLEIHSLMLPSAVYGVGNLGEKLMLIHQLCQQPLQEFLVSTFRAMLSVQDAILTKPDPSTTRQHSLRAELAALLFSVFPPIVQKLSMAAAEQHGEHDLVAALLKLPEAQSKMMARPFVQMGLTTAAEFTQLYQGDPIPPVPNESVQKMTAEQLEAPGGIEKMNVIDVMTLKTEVLPMCSAENAKAIMRQCMLCLTHEKPVMHAVMIDLVCDIISGSNNEDATKPSEPWLLGALCGFGSGCDEICLSVLKAHGVIPKLLKSVAARVLGNRAGDALVHQAFGLLMSVLIAMIELGPLEEEIAEQKLLLTSNWCLHFRYYELTETGGTQQAVEDANCLLPAVTTPEKLKEVALALTPWRLSYGAIPALIKHVCDSQPAQCLGVLKQLSKVVPYVSMFALLILTELLTNYPHITQKCHVVVTSSPKGDHKGIKGMIQGLITEMNGIMEEKRYWTPLRPRLNRATKFLNEALPAQPKGTGSRDMTKIAVFFQDEEARRSPDMLCALRQLATRIGSEAFSYAVLRVMLADGNTTHLRRASEAGFALLSTCYGSGTAVNFYSRVVPTVLPWLITPTCALRFADLLVRAIKTWPTAGLSSVVELLTTLLCRYPSEPNDPKHLLAVLFFNIAACVRSPWLPKLVKDLDLCSKDICVALHAAGQGWLAMGFQPADDKLTMSCT